MKHALWMQDDIARLLREVALQQAARLATMAPGTDQEQFGHGCADTLSAVREAFSVSEARQILMTHRDAGDGSSVT